MTLVIVKIDEDNISLSSDSRITFNDENSFDFGIKIFSFPIKIFSPGTQETESPKLEFNQKVGFGVIGSSINAYTVKDSIYEILQHLQYIPIYTDVSFAGIARLVFKLYKISAEGLRYCLPDGKGFCEIILCGFCPVEQKFRIFHYNMELVEGVYQPTYNEIIEKPSIWFYGSGAQTAEKIYTTNPEYHPLRIIREVIKSGTVPTVGGGLQYGDFKDLDFKVYGIVDYLADDDKKHIELLYTLRGINLYRDELDREIDGFHINYTFLEPFKHEIDELFKKMW